MNDCIEFPGYRDRDGYGRISVNGKVFGAHVLSLMLAIGRRLKDGKYALHKCNNPPCINPAHLYEGTQKQNMGDAWRSGSLSVEILCGQRKKKHSQETIDTVLSLRDFGYTIKKISLSLSIPRSTVGHIVSGYSYKRR